jgi:transcription elongation GreA/GreB family factor
MSVAFRRESDEEHLEPRFEIPIPPGPNLVTPRGLALINAQVGMLEAKLAALTRDGAPDDALTAAKRDLRYWQTRQVTAEVVALPTGDTVEIGTSAKIMLNGQKRVIAIVGHDEAEPAAGRLAYSAPLARALLGGEAGDLLDFGGKPEAITLIAVSVTEP